MINFLKVNIKDKHDFIMFNKDNGKWFTKKLEHINSGMGFNEQQSYLEAKAKAYKAEQANRKTINDLQHFRSALLERTSEVFKLLTTIQNKSLEQEKEIVTQLKNVQIIDPLKAIENKPGDLNLKDVNSVRQGYDQHTGGLCPSIRLEILKEHYLKMNVLIKLIPIIIWMNYLV